MRNLLREGLLKAIKEKKEELEYSRKKGLKVKDTDLPVMAAGCAYSGIIRYGFSNKRKHVSKEDKKSLDALLLNKLRSKCPTAGKIPGVIFKKNHKPGNLKGNMAVVDKYVGTCAEDNAANLILLEYSGGKAGKPTDLKTLTFDYPIRTRTFKRERMCVVCRELFTEP